MNIAEIAGSFASKKFGGVIVGMCLIAYLAFQQPAVIAQAIWAISLILVVYVFAQAKWGDTRVNGDGNGTGHPEPKA